MFSGTITVFNQYTAPDDTVSWYPHVLSDIHLELNKSQLIKKYGVECTDKAEVYISYTADGEKKTITDSAGTELEYLPPKEWKAQESDALAESITFGEDDFFWVGTWEGDNPVNDEDYTDRLTEGFYAYMNRTKDAVFKITSAGVYNVIPHFEIVGK